MTTLTVAALPLTKNKHGSVGKAMAWNRRKALFEHAIRCQVAAKGSCAWRGGHCPNIAGPQGDGCLRAVTGGLKLPAAERVRVSVTVFWDKPGPLPDPQNLHQANEACADALVRAGVLTTDQTGYLGEQPVVVRAPRGEGRTEFELTLSPEPASGSSERVCPGAVGQEKEKP